MQQRDEETSKGIGRIRENLLDVDSIRSASAFNTKPVSSVLWLGTANVLFFPFAWTWWREKHVSFPWFCFGSTLYFLQAIISILVVMRKLPDLCQGITEAQTRDLRTEIMLPIILWSVAAVQYGHLVAASQPERKMGFSRSARLQEVVTSHERRQEDDVSDDDDEEEDEPYSEELQEREKKVSARGTTSVGGAWATALLH